MAEFFHPEKYPTHYHLAVLRPNGGLWEVDVANQDVIFDLSFHLPSCPFRITHGQVWGLPVGLSFFAGAWQEGAIITLAYAYEQATKWRVAPGFAGTVGMV